MSIKKISALCLSFAAIGAAGAAPALAASGSVDPDAVLPNALPPGCDLEVWWNTSGNPMAGAEVPNPTYCVRRILAPLVHITVDLPPLPEISAE